MMHKAGNERSAVEGTHRTDVFLQQLVDATAARGGGEVVVPAGVYQMADSLRLRTGVHLRAKGKVILRKAPSVSSPLLDIVGYGHAEFRVADPQLFRPGMGISISSGKVGGFGVTVARIVGQTGDTFYIDTPLHRDYWPSHGAVATHVFPIIAGYGVEDASVEGVIIEGDREDPARLDGCRGGGVFLIGCRGISLRELEIRHYPGDAISFQQCVDVFVVNCDLHDNVGHGMHPGSGSVRYVLRGNRIRDNGGCGIYYCLRTTHSECVDNLIHDNGEEGISIGERDTDHLIEDNDIQRNARSGLGFRDPQIQSGERVIVRHNHFSDNGRTVARAQVQIGKRLRDVHLIGNTFTEGDEPAISVADQCAGIVIVGNRRVGQPLSPEDVQTNSAVQWTSPVAQLAVGPGTLELDGARHLRIPSLPEWNDQSVPERQSMPTSRSNAIPVGA